MNSLPTEYADNRNGGRMKQTAYLLCAALALTVCTATDAGIYQGSPTAKQIAWMDRGMDSVKGRLRDPGSAQFRNVFFHHNSIPVACGEVNAKNALGGYTGFEKFISAGKPGLTFLQSDVADFWNLWAQLCN